MTLSQIRREIEALKRKYAKELAIVRLRRQAEEVCDQWERAVNDQQEPPQPHAVVGKMAAAGFFLSTYITLHHYVKRIREQGKLPEPRQIVLNLLPWAGEDRYISYLTCDLPAPVESTRCSPEGRKLALDLVVNLTVLPARRHEPLNKSLPPRRGKVRMGVTSSAISPLRPPAFRLPPFAENSIGDRTLLCDCPGAGSSSFGHHAPVPAIWRVNRRAG